MKRQRSAHLRDSGRAALVIVAVLAVALALAWPETSPAAEQDLEARANSAFQAGDWQGAAQLYAQLVESQSESAAAWYRLGLSTVRSGGDTSEGRASYETAIELGFPPSPAVFGIARSWALDGDTEAVLETLGRLKALGPSRAAVARLQSEQAFEALSSSEEFQVLVRELTPCATAEYRQFDFWLGTWRVESPQGQVLGTNTITESMEGCLVMEHWTSASGHKGISMNYYDHRDRTWTQIFRDNTGNVGTWPILQGTLVDGAMVLESPPHAQPLTRWVWTPLEGGRVRQMAESSSDGGETWSVIWDSYYVLEKD